MSDPWHITHRPTTWDDVVGNAAEVEAIRSLAVRGSSRAFMLVGPSGVGKTTIARLIAATRGIDMSTPHSPSYLELDAATRTGVDDARSLMRSLELSPLGGGGDRVVCLDEAHMLSKPAWNALLKSVEEPPRGVTWVFCTTEPSKVPKAIQTRCSGHVLKPLTARETRGLLLRVGKAEAVDPVLLERLSLDTIAEASGGAARAAVVLLNKVVAAGASNADDVAELCGAYQGEDSADVADLCRALGRGASWHECARIVGRLEGTGAETIRTIVCAWFTKVALRAATEKGGRSQKSAQRALAVLDAFGTPYPSTTSLYPVLLSLGQLTLLGTS